MIVQRVVQPLGRRVAQIRGFAKLARPKPAQPIITISGSLYTRPEYTYRTRQITISQARTSRPISTAKMPEIQPATPSSDHILTLSCADKPGIVYAVTGVLATHGHTILDLQQFSDPSSSRFFMRVHFGHTTSTNHLVEPLAALAREHGWAYHDIRSAGAKPKLLIMVSKIGHCLNELLFRARTGQLNVDIPMIVSNHPDFRALADSYGIPFHHLPVTKETKPEQEAKVLSLIREQDIDLVVLARYMQVLSSEFCASMNKTETGGAGEGTGRIINIHHAFLPSFKGAKPYHQAYDRGVKMIGATAHFVTADLDEGPIIEQNVARVDHSMDPKKLVDMGAAVESQVLADAVKWWSERKVFLNENKTVVFT